jgi:hypothetical protein
MNGTDSSNDVDRRTTFHKLAQQLQAAIDDASKLTVVTCVTAPGETTDTSPSLNTTIELTVDEGMVQVGQARVRVAALTEIALDSDTKVILPVEGDLGALQIDQTLLEIHERHVAKALEARQALFDSVIGLLRINP